MEFKEFLNIESLDGGSEICGSEWKMAKLELKGLKIGIYYTTNPEGEVDYIDITVKKESKHGQGIEIRTEPNKSNMLWGISSDHRDWDEYYRHIDKWLDYPNLEYAVNKIGKYLK